MRVAGGHLWFLAVVVIVGVVSATLGETWDPLAFRNDRLF